ncbi:MAG: hypothetical protein M3Q95_09525 [Bacteroidota bacterium]|nr:hypothetical protein [Bacteroidota bacterium]
MAIVKHGIGFLFVLLASLSLQAQSTSQDIAGIEKQLRQYADSVMKGSTDKTRQVALAAFNPVFLDLLNQPGSFDYPFDSLPSVSKVTSADKKVRIYTWILPSREDGTYKFFGIIQRINPETRQMKVIGLTDLSLPTEEASVNELKADTWYGAAYYELIEKKISKKPHYFLLGWKGNDRFSTKKVIDVLTFDAWDNVTFGAPLFIDEKKLIKHRMIFEFNAQAVMLLRYEKKMIVFDHLSPSSLAVKGQFRHYGPDFTYDGLQFKKGEWHYKTNLDLRNSGDRR